MQNKNYQTEQCLGVIKRAVATTGIPFEEYTGGSVSLTKSANGLVGKLNLFFGYKNNKPLAKTILINVDEAQDFFNAIIVSSEILFSNDFFSFNDKAKLKPKPKTVKVKTTKLAVVKECPIKKEVLATGAISEKSLDLLIEHRNNLTKDGKVTPVPLNTKQKMAGLVNAIKKYAQHWKISDNDALDFYLSHNWQTLRIQYDYDIATNAPKFGSADFSQESEDDLHQKKIRWLKKQNPNANDEQISVLFNKMMDGDKQVALEAV